MAFHHAYCYSMECSSKFQSSQGIAHKGTWSGQYRLFSAGSKWALNFLLLGPNFCNHGTFSKHITSGELHSFPLAAVTNYHQLAGFKGHMLFSYVSVREVVPPLMKSKIHFGGPKSRCWLGHRPSGGVGKNLLTFAGICRYLPYVPWLKGPASILKGNSRASCFSGYIASVCEDREERAFFWKEW